MVLREIYGADVNIDQDVSVAGRMDRPVADGEKAGGPVRRRGRRRRRRLQEHPFEDSRGQMGRTGGRQAHQGARQRPVGGPAGQADSQGTDPRPGGGTLEVLRGIGGTGSDVREGAVRTIGELLKIFENKPDKPKQSPR